MLEPTYLQSLDIASIERPACASGGLRSTEAQLEVRTHAAAAVNTIL